MLLMVSFQTLPVKSNPTYTETLKLYVTELDAYAELELKGTNLPINKPLSNFKGLSTILKTSLWVAKTETPLNVYKIGLPYLPEGAILEIQYQPDADKTSILEEANLVVKTFQEIFPVHFQKHPLPLRRSFHFGALELMLVHVLYDRGLYLLVQM